MPYSHLQKILKRQIVMQAFPNPPQILPAFKETPLCLGNSYHPESFTFYPSLTLPPATSCGWSNHVQWGWRHLLYSLHHDLHHPLQWLGNPTSDLVIPKTSGLHHSYLLCASATTPNHSPGSHKTLSLCPKSVSLVPMPCSLNITIYPTSINT